MEIRVKLAHEWRTIEHAQKVVISPDNGDPGSLDIEFESDGVSGNIVVIKEGATDGG